MSFLVYQRSSPRHEDWLQLKSQQVRLRNLVQIIGVNLGIPENSEIFFTLHVTPLSAPFFTSERIPRAGGQRVYPWKEIEPENAYYSGIRFSAKGCTIRIWSKSRKDEQCQPVLTWGVYFEGLHWLGPHNDWSSDMFENNVILFRTPFGVFTAESCIKPRPTSLTKYLVISKTLADCKPSYKCKLLASLHRKQRAIIEEVKLAIDLKSECETLAFVESGNNSVPANERRIILSSRGRKIRPGSKKMQLTLKKQIEEAKFKVLSLEEEKGRAEGRLQRIKKEKLGLEEMNKELLDRIDSLNNERRSLQQFKMTLIDKRQRLSQLRSDVFIRKKQLISELSVIYPLMLIDSVKFKRYSINGAQLLEPEFLDYEGGGQSSVALGYTAHLVSMLCFFLGIPLRYPIRHFGSRSRIRDHIAANIQERDREFPLYFKGKQDVFCQYGRYLLDKNVAQVRWYCGLVTQDLKATLPNLASLIHKRLSIKGWDPNYDDDTLKVAEEITEESDRILFRSENSISLDKGLDDLHIQEDKLQNNLSNSVANIDYATNNSVAVGDIYRGRAQEKFVTGWKKTGGPSQAEEIDPSWLVTSSMDADSDCGRRLSTCVRSRQSDFESSIVSNSSDPGKPRRRRIGQVFLPGQFANEPNANKDISTMEQNEMKVSPVRGEDSSDSSHHHIPDGSVQARQLRLLDRKISMYFGEQQVTNVQRSVRRTRSFDKLVYNNSPSLDRSVLPERQEKGKGALETVVSQGATIGIAGIGGIGGETYFNCAVNSDVSDIETDNCDFHVNPPVEIPTAKEVVRIRPKLESSETEILEKNEASPSQQPETVLGAAAPHPDEKAPSLEILSQNDVTTRKVEPQPKDNKTGSLHQVEVNSDEKEEFPESLEFLMESGRQSSEAGLEDESLWNRTEALMSSFQSFNLIRKSTVDPK